MYNMKTLKVQKRFVQSNKVIYTLGGGTATVNYTAQDLLQKVLKENAHIQGLDKKQLYKDAGRYLELIAINEGKGLYVLMKPSKEKVSFDKDTLIKKMQSGLILVGNCYLRQMKSGVTSIVCKDSDKIKYIENKSKKAVKPDVKVADKIDYAKVKAELKANGFDIKHYAIYREELQLYLLNRVLPKKEGKQYVGWFKTLGDYQKALIRNILKYLPKAQQDILRANTEEYTTIIRQVYGDKYTYTEQEYADYLKDDYTWQEVVEAVFMDKIIDEETFRAEGYDADLDFKTHTTSATTGWNYTSDMAEECTYKEVTGLKGYDEAVAQFKKDKRDEFVKYMQERVIAYGKPLQYLVGIASKVDTEFDFDEFIPSEESLCEEENERLLERQKDAEYYQGYDE